MAVAVWFIWSSFPSRPVWDSLRELSELSSEYVSV